MLSHSSAHLAYLVESLKVSANLLATHLMGVDDASDCQVFKANAALIRADEASSSSAPGVMATVLIVAAVLVAAMVGTAAVSGLAHKKRWVPRVRAWLDQAPYKDMVIGAAAASVASPGERQSQGDPNIAAMERRSEERDGGNSERV